jgi:uncharacterized protein YbjT (DUF2867 family)
MPLGAPITSTAEAAAGPRGEHSADRQLPPRRRENEFGAKIVVVGASGRIGTRLTAVLRRRGCRVSEVSPSLGVDTLTRRGLARAFEGAVAVVDCSNPRRGEFARAEDFFLRSGTNIIEVGRRAGVGRYVVLSIVGLDNLLAGAYFQAKKAQETIVETSGMPFSIIRSTQFFEFISGVVQEGNAREIPVAPALVQPIAADDLAAFLANGALTEPAKRIVEVAGPERFHLDELATEIATLFEDGRSIVPDPRARYFGAELQECSLIPSTGALIGATRFDDWLRSSVLPKKLHRVSSIRAHRLVRHLPKPTAGTRR